MMPFMEEYFASPASPYSLGQQQLPFIEKSLQAVYELVQSDERDTCVVTSCGAEGICQVIHSVFKTVTKSEAKNHFVTSVIDEAPAILAMSRLEEEGCSFQMAKVTPSGYVTAETVREAITPRTALVSLSWACALTGVVQPIHEIAQLCRQRGILLHVDATHVLGKLSLDMETPDFITLNGEQLHAPKGIGMLIARKQCTVLPLIAGQEDTLRKRGGSVNVPLIVALGQAAIEAKQNQNLYCLEVARLRNAFEARLIREIPEVRVLFQDTERLPHVSCVLFLGIKNELLLYALNRKGICATMGGGPFQQIQIVLKACGVDPIDAQCGISLSLSKDTTEEELESVVATMCQVVKRLRRTSGGLYEH